MSLIDGFKANTGEDGLIGVVKDPDGRHFGVYTKKPVSEASHGDILEVISVSNTVETELSVDSTVDNTINSRDEFEWVEKTN